MNNITFRKAKVAIIAPAPGIIGSTIYSFEWRLFLDGKRVPDTCVLARAIGEGKYSLFQCRCEGVPLCRPMNEKILKVFIIEDFFTLIDAKKALVDYFNKNYEQ